MAESLHTARLLLRNWKDEDLAPFAALNADPVVMEFFADTLSRDRSDHTARVFASQIRERGWGLWAVEEVASGRFIGFVGLSIPNWQAAFTPCVEVGWRLALPFWGKGYATEAGKSSLEYGFERLGLPEIVSFTTAPNVRSQKVMQRLGMTRNPMDDFDHPHLEPGHCLQRHVLYRISRDHWRRNRNRAK